MHEKILLFPFGGNAREALTVIADINKDKETWDVLGFIDDNESLRGREIQGVEVLGGRDILGRYGDAKVLAVPGNPSEYLQRRKIIDELQFFPQRFATVIHPSVVCSADAEVGFNSLLTPNVVINQGSRVGNHCVILPNTVISHESSVGSYSCIGSNVSISGSVSIGEQCYIGSGVTVKDGVTIGEGSLIGIGSNVLEDVPAGEVRAGNPAKFLRKI